MCALLTKYKQIEMVQDQKLGLNEIKFGDFLVAMRGILRPYNKPADFDSSSTLVENYLTNSYIEKTQNEVTSALNTVLQNAINNTDITWGLDDAVDIMMTTGSAIINGNL